MTLPRNSKFTSDDLWNQYFKVSFPYLPSRTVESIRAYGVRVSDNPEFGQNREAEWVSTELNIDSIFEKHRRGIPIRITNYNDTALIYEIVHSHILACADALAHNINIGDLPLKDLVELDEFAAKVYDKARFVFNEEERSSAIANNFMSTVGFNFFNILKRSAGTVREEAFSSNVRKNDDAPISVNATNDSGVPKTPDRNSYKELFAADLARAEGWKGKL